jgi:hypothetical protein
MMRNIEEIFNDWMALPEKARRQPEVEYVYRKRIAKLMGCAPMLNKPDDTVYFVHVLEFIKDNPLCYKRDIAVFFHITLETVNARITILRKKRLIRTLVGPHKTSPVQFVAT